MNRRSRSMIALAILALLATLAPSALSAQGQGRNKKYVGTREIIVDAQTGQLRRPTAEETQQLVDNLVTLVNQSTENLAPVPSTSAVGIDLDGRFASAALARPNPDGTTEIQCVTTFQEGAAFLGLVEDTSAQ